MIDTTFNIFWEELKDYYKKGFPTRNTNIDCYAQAVKYVPSESKNDLLAEIYGTCTTFPKISDFRTICKPFERRPEKARVFNETTCPYCLNSGLIKYTRNVQGVAYKSEFFAYCSRCNVGLSFKSQFFRSFEELYGEKGLNILREKNQSFLRGKSLSDFQHQTIQNLSKMGSNTL